MAKLKRPPLTDADRSLFQEAVRDAKPLPHHGKALRSKEAPPAFPVQSLLDDKEALKESLTAEWTAEDWLDSGEEPNFLRPGLSRQVLRKLRSGSWVVQKELDLHGFDRHEAREALAGFFASCIRRGIRCVRVIHGKGLGSKNREPVLKTKVKHWLLRREEVLAYCQARPVDGGSGALLVLLKG
jgi:DNA-nicking Smr family endonuclease